MANAAFPGATADREKRRPVLASGSLLSNAGLTWVSPASIGVSGGPYPTGSDSPGSSAPPQPAQPAVGDVPRGSRRPPLKPVQRFVPRSWKSFFQRWRRAPEPRPPLTRALAAQPRSPPVSPLLVPASDSGSQEPSWCSPQAEPVGVMPPPGSPPAWCSEEAKLEACRRKYAYMKSWPGLLRLLAGLQLLCGGLVFACVCAYIQKDYAGASLVDSGLLWAGYGDGYYQPMTPFVLTAAGLAWLATVTLLSLGLTRYYRSVLLDSPWWPLAEFGISLALFLLYLAAAIVYVNDVTRGGLCYSLFSRGPLVAALCRVAGGQVAALALLFITALLYLASALVCLKMWRHETARRHREPTEAPHSPVLLPARPKRIIFQDEVVPRSQRAKVTKCISFSEKGGEPATTSCSIPTGHMPKPHVLPDYVVKYPAISSPEEREKYKAVFYDQHAEYRELHGEVRAALQKFQELDAMMGRLPWRARSRQEQSRVSNVCKEYKKKRSDPAFLEKQERCAYLKKKLTHLKAQIQDYDCRVQEGAVYF
ncbi:PREDICTED: occludin/ELL domain-containing protein 1 [Crocodylus porosus]|uniref:occludin/ELL domain-containing protein 1 n=1 Tax=Crocodylus porosus TaxID=8502 RepID=UPI000938B67E|nr:PREDICTED: occludin/ELL domain-containing protein 1 [Crocodylus porosus]